ncbi:MAG: DUF3368 domain-containing protein [Phycisphaeraceae bacterium]
MIVVADSSPLIVLVNIGHVDVLPRLFGRLLIPSQVSDELAALNRPAAVREFIRLKPDWLEIRDPAVIERIAGLHAGETSAIRLAVELKADLLVIDERAGRKVASERGIAVVGTVGILERAADLGLIDLAIAYDRIKCTDFWVNPQLLDESLQRHHARLGGP